MKITSIGRKGLELIKFYEGFYSKPYLCPAGVWTIGYGTTFYFDTKKRVGPNDKSITKEEADRLLIGHIDSIFAPLVDKLVRDDITQNQFDALVSFCYNTGGGYIDKQGKFNYFDLFNNVNNRMSKDDLIKYWSNCAITGGGKKLNGLISRRKKEVDLYFL